MTVEEGAGVASIPVLRGKVSSVDLPLFKLHGVYFVRVSDPSESVRCSVAIHGNELAIEFTIADLL